MSFPVIDIYINKIEENAVQIQKMLKEKNIDLTAVVKGFAGDLKVFKAFQNAAVNSIADSRLQNIKKYREAGYQGEIMMLRIPMPSELKEAVKYIDTTLLSEIKTARAAAEAAVKAN
ncbi:MAG: alanine/ornithine racemase family PLP-dependent enzyme, partial [Halanaerobium sp. MSAO_Bac5]